MTALVIKNLPEGVLSRLKEQARANHRSLTKQAIVLLELGVQAVPATPVAPTPAVNPVTAAVSTPPADGMEALRAALVLQPDGSYINLLGIDDAEFFNTLDHLRGEFKLPDPIDFGTGKT